MMLIRNRSIILCTLLLSILIAACSQDESHIDTFDIDNFKADYTLPNGDQYQGEFKNKLFHGLGTLVYVQGGYYNGQFQNGLMTGEGVYVDNDETRYEGQFKHGKYHGKGLITYADESRYEGNFQDGSYHGQGKYTHNETWYQGSFIDGSLEGQGEYIDYQGARYKGDVKSWVANGKGKITLADGTTAEGIFENGSIQEGEKHNSDGSHYKGTFEYGEYDGEGVLTFANGSVYDGEFSYGRYHGNGTLTIIDKETGDKKVRQGRWKNNSLLINTITGEHFYDQAEIALERHQMLLNNSLLNLQDSDPGSANVYFLGVAGDGKQSVFRREIETVERIIQQRYNTQGRSISLINHHDSAETYPLATRRSIAAAINAIGQKMNADDDVLVMYLSSHGSKEFELTMRHDSIQLPDLSAQALQKSFAKANIKWKVLFISACYSGGFIPELENEHTLILTAADSENTSFGCSEESEMTYFGKALFNEVLNKEPKISLTDAFTKATKLIDEWEEKEELDSSNPMISAPKGILKKLIELQK